MRHIIISTFIVLFATMLAGAQPAQYTTGKADQTLQGSGRVNSSTMAMEFSLPMGNYPGRGINMPVGLSYSSKVWQLQYGGTTPYVNVSGCYSTNSPQFAEKTSSGWTSSLAVPYIEYTGYQVYDPDGNVYRDDVDIACSPRGGGTSFQPRYIKRVLLHLPGGETHELRVTDTVQTSVTYDGSYYAVDNSNIKYVEDSSNSVYRVQLPDGSYYDLATGSSGPDRYATRYTDRNGNYIVAHAANSTYPSGYWTDTLGRDLPLPPAVPSSAGTTTYSIPGISGNISYILHWKLLKGSSSGTSALTNYSDSLRYYGETYIGSGSILYSRSAGTFLFGSEYDGKVLGSGTFNPMLLTEIELPTGLSYKFSYNVYGEIDKIVYPTGGEERFTYDVVPAMSPIEAPYSNTNRGVVDRKVYESSSDTTPYEWTYTFPSNGSRRITDPDGTKVETWFHTGSSSSKFGFDGVLPGMPYRELVFTSDNHLVAQKLTHWTKTSIGSNGAEWHPRVDYEESIVYDTSGNGISATTLTEYNGNLSNIDTPVLSNATTVYGFVAASSGSSITPGGSSTMPSIPSATPTTTVRKTESTYLIDDSNYSAVKSYYTAQNINGLVTVSKAKDGSGTVVSQSETVYDESGRSPGYVGNPTTAKSWDSTKGAVTSSGNFIATHVKFDSYGNQYESTDALGNTTTTTFDSTYHAFPITVTSPIADSTNTWASNSAFVSSATFDPTSGLPLTTTDANGLKTEITYDSTTLRPRYVKYYNGSTQIGPTNETIYHDETGNVWVKSKNQIDDSHYAESISYFDGLGRAWKAEEVNSEGNVFVEKEFDADGRVYRVSNPYRTGDTKVWTTNTYDTASRVVSVALPDSSTVTTDYGVSTSTPIGVTKTITDQAGKKRKGYSDVLGNMVRVIEDPTSSALVTDYTFDTLGNLRKTSQGSQYRYFMHDSLGRLLYAKQVEQDTNSAFSATDPITGNTAWSVKYQYDDNGNITSTTDANNVSVTASYDHLNRIYNRNYSDSTPDVDFYYDGRGLGGVPSFSNGKTTKITSSASETKYMSFDIFGHLLTHRQTTDGNNYDTSYAYNIAGALIEETYPSGRVVKNTFDENGDLSQLRSSKNSSSGFWTYARGFDYDKAGNLKKFQLGNGRWETFSYNNRQQITQIGLGTLDSSQDLLKLEYKYETSGYHDNNGSMREQTITVPTVGGTGGFTAIQSYAYDDLNRLLSATETVSSSQTWKQEFSYDRYGNKNFVTGSGHTTTLGSCSTAICNPTISTSTNRISSSGYTFDANGSMTVNAVGERFAYDAENHQTKFFLSTNSGSDPDGEYKYDGEGRRIKKISSTETTIFVYDGAGQNIAEYSTALATTQQVSYLTADHLGSPRVTTNESGTVTNRKDFAAFGDEVASTQRVSGNKYAPADEVREDYTGYQKDEESGLEFAQARYYNRTHGRYTSIDPMFASASIKNPQTFNRYSYVLNSPYKFSDPLGLISMATGACGSWCNNSAGGFNQGLIGLFSGMGQSVETIDIRSESQSDAAASTPAAKATSGDSEPPPIISFSEDKYVVAMGTVIMLPQVTELIPDDGSIGEEREEKLNNPSSVPVSPNSSVTLTPYVMYNTTYSASFSMRTAGASLEGYSYEVSYEGGMNDSPRSQDRVEGRQTIGADGNVNLGKFHITTVSRASDGFNPKLTGERSLNGGGTVKIFDRGGTPVATSSFRISLRTFDADSGNYVLSTTETARTTSYGGSWKRQ